MEYASLYWDFVKIKLKSIVEYPGAFWAETFAKFMGFASQFIVTFLLVYRFETLAGWTAYEILLFTSINITAYSLAGFFMFNPFAMLSMHIQQGTFDEMLTKPLNPFFYLCGKGFLYGYIGNLIASIGTMIIAIVNLNFNTTFYNMMMLIVFIIGGALIHCALFMFFNIPAFWIIKSDALITLKWSLDDFARYPLNIYNKFIQFFLIIIVPISFINFFPVAFLLGKDNIGFNPNLALLTPVIGIMLTVLGYKFFFFAIKHYSSTGS